MVTSEANQKVLSSLLHGLSTLNLHCFPFSYIVLDFSVQTLVAILIHMNMYVIKDGLRTKYIISFIETKFSVIKIIIFEYST